MNELCAKRIKTEPDPYEPFCISLGFQIGNLLFLSGHAAIGEGGEVVGVGDFDAQAEQTFRNLAQTLHAAGSDMSRVVKVTIYLSDMRNFQKIVTLRKRWFSKPYPADTIVEISSLALRELMIEIEAVALVDGQMID